MSSISISMPVSSSEPQTAKPACLTVIETAKCFSCGFTEPAYILRKCRHEGRWLCGLCIEAVNDEVLRSEKLISVIVEALERHISFCNTFRESSFHDQEETEHPISAMGRILRRSKDSPQTLRFSSTGSLPETGDLTFFDDVPPLPVRSGSCFSSLSS